MLGRQHIPAPIKVYRDVEYLYLEFRNNTDAIRFYRAIASSLTSDVTVLDDTLKQRLAYL